MSDTKNQTSNQTLPSLSNAEKETARRLGMSERDYAEGKKEAVRRGKIQG